MDDVFVKLTKWSTTCGETRDHADMWGSQLGNNQIVGILDTFV